MRYLSTRINKSFTVVVVDVVVVVVVVDVVVVEGDVVAVDVTVCVWLLAVVVEKMIMSKLMCFGKR
jgi:hypothetical protein